MGLTPLHYAPLPVRVPRPSNVSTRFADGPDMWNLTPSTRTGKEAARCAVMGAHTDWYRDLLAHKMLTEPHLFEDAERDSLLDALAYRMHTEPEQYTDAQHDLMLARAETRKGDEWDCHTCRTAVVTSDFNDPCPHCGQ
jgi:rubrerythrin